MLNKQSAAHTVPSYDVSIEYSHIYTNQRISEEHKTSLEILGQLKKSLEPEGKTSSLVVLVDDYSFPDPTFNYDEFSTWLDKRKFKPDFMVRESQLIPWCDQVLGQVQNKNLKKQITDYIKAKRYPCSLFIAAWYLMRLGKIQSPLVPPSLQAGELINILPESFKPFEDKGLEIISETPYSQCLESISYRYLPGRLIA